MGPWHCVLGPPSSVGGAQWGTWVPAPTAQSLFLRCELLECLEMTCGFFISELSCIKYSCHYYSQQKWVFCVLSSVPPPISNNVSRKTRPPITSLLGFLYMLFLPTQEIKVHAMKSATSLLEFCRKWRNSSCGVIWFRCFFWALNFIPRVKHLGVVGFQRRGTAAGCGFQRTSVPLSHGHALMQEVLKEGYISPRYLLILFWKLIL